MGLIEPVTSVTHAHLAYVLAAEVSRGRDGRDGTIRVLDAGCGGGDLLLALHHHLPALTGRQVELYGFDVSDARVQRSDFFGVALAKLALAESSVPWAERLQQIRTDEEWPFPAGTFDFVVSNQVLEHVADLPAFMANVARVLAPGGLSVNLFPTKSLLVEGHVGAPLAHRVASNDTREWLLTRFARMGLSRVGPMRLVDGLTPEEYGRTRSEYVATQTFYRSFREFARAAHIRGLVPTYRWTSQFYTTKLGYVFGWDTSNLYRRRSWAPVADAISFPILSRFSGVTISFQKSGAYDPDEAHAGHLK